MACTEASFRKPQINENKGVQMAPSSNRFGKWGTAGFGALRACPQFNRRIYVTIIYPQCVKKSFKTSVPD